MTVHAKATNKVSVQEAQQIAEDAYIYGYPLITMEMTRRVMTNVREPEGTRGPMGHLLRIRSYPTAAFKDVTAPNADTLYTTAWLDHRHRLTEIRHHRPRLEGQTPGGCNGV